MRLYKMRLRREWGTNPPKRECYVVAGDPTHALTLAIHAWNQKVTPPKAKQLETRYTAENVVIERLEELAQVGRHGNLVLPYDMVRCAGVVDLD